MSDNIAIPKNAIEAAKRDAAVTIYRLVEPDTRAHELTEDEVGEIVLAACLAMLRSWPGMEYVFRQPARYSVCYSKPALILPLPKEKTNDQP